MRRVQPNERAAMGLRLSHETIALAHRAIQRACPELDPARCRLKFVELHYGAELAQRLEVWMTDRGLLG